MSSHSVAQAEDNAAFAVPSTRRPAVLKKA